MPLIKTENLILLKLKAEDADGYFIIIIMENFINIWIGMALNPLSKPKDKSEYGIQDLRKAGLFDLLSLRRQLML